MALQSKCCDFMAGAEWHLAVAPGDFSPPVSAFTDIHTVAKASEPLKFGRSNLVLSSGLAVPVHLYTRVPTCSSVTE